MKNPLSLLRQKIDTLRYNIGQNGLHWTAYFVFFRFTEWRLKRLGRLQTQTAQRMAKLELAGKLPGLNTVRRNYHIWEELTDWEHKGEVWTESEEWKQALIDDVLMKEIEHGKTVLEIGPGGGRWTEALQKISSHLILIDLSARCIEICKERFAAFNNLEYHVTQGTDISFIPSDSVDFIWSFDVFVHISPQDTEQYVQQFSRILRKGGRGIIHHAREGGLHGGWRSRMTDKLMAEFAQKNGMKIIRQFDSWGPDGKFQITFHHDVITIFEKL